MSFFQHSFLDPANAARSADDVGGLLRQFFQAEMPDPWPKLRLPEEPPSAVAPVHGRGWTLLRSRVALAASVALLVGGHVLLANSFRGEDAVKSSGSKDPVVAKRPSGNGSTPPRAPVQSTVTPRR